MSYEEFLDVVPLNFSEEVVTWVVSKLTGSAGVAGSDVVQFRNWILCSGKSLEALQVEPVEWANWLANGSPHWTV